MVRINRVYISNFKNIEYADVNFGPLNVLVGPNGSGKSNFLAVTSFLGFLINASNDSVKRLLLHGRNSNFGRFFSHVSFNKEKKTEKLEEPLFIEIDFSDSDTEFQYKYNITLSKSDAQKYEHSHFIISDENLTFKKKSNKGKAIQLMAQKNGQISFHNPINKYFPVGKMSDLSVSGIRLLDLVLKTNSHLSSQYSHAIESLNKVLSIDTIYLSSHALKYNNYNALDSFESRLINFDLEEQIKNLDESDQWPVFLDAVKQITGFDDIKVIDLDSDTDSSTKEKFVAYYYSNRVNLIGDLSDGEVMLLGLIAKIVTNKSDIIFIEELENSIHPKALHSIINLMLSYCDSKQFLISTHSATLLNMVSPECVFVASVNEFDLAEITMIKNIKELKKKLSHGFISFGDLIYQSDVESNEDKFEELF